MRSNDLLAEQAAVTTSITTNSLAVHLVNLGNRLGFPTRVPHRGRRLRTLNVLLLDDTAKVLENLTGEDFSVVADGDIVKIKLYTAHIKIWKGDFTKETIENLVVICQNCIFDYIFSDYAYIFSSTENNNLRDTINNLSAEERQKVWLDREVGRNAFRTLADLPSKVDELANSNRKLDRANASILRRSLIEHTGDLLIYTNSPTPFDSRFEGLAGVDVQRTFTNAFKYAKKRENLVVKMHKDFIIKPEAQKEWDKAAVDEFKSAIVSANLQSVLREEALRKIVAERRDMRFVRNKKVMRKIFIHSIVVGLVGALWSTVVFELITFGYQENVNIFVAVSFLGLSMVLFFFIMFRHSSKIEREYSVYTEHDD